jgi:hypothetical protein
VAIAQQLQAEGTAQSNSGQTVSVTLGAGSNRYMVVALCAEIGSGTQAPPTSVTYGGNALTLITDGTVTASQVSTVAGVFLYRLLEADMPANGANNLVVSWPATTTYVMGWWILTGVNQGNASDVKILAQTTTATSITVTLDAGATTDAVICACYKNDTTGTVAITISGAGVTEDFDLSFGSARGAAGTDLPAVASGTIACVATVSSTSRRILVAIRLAEAPTSVDITGSVTTSSPTVSGSVTDGTVQPPSFISIQAGPNGGTTNIVGPTTATYLLVVAAYRSAAVGSGATATFNGSAMSVANNSNAWVQLFYMFNPPEVNGVVSVTGASISEIVTAQYENVDSFSTSAQGSVDSHSFSPGRRALLVFGMASTGGSTPLADTEERYDTGGDCYSDRIVTTGGTFEVGASDGSDPDSAAALFLGLEDGTGEDLTGAVTTSSATVTGALQTPHNITGAVSKSGATVSGALQTPANLTGALNKSGATVAGALQTPANLTGALTTSTLTVAGSVQAAANATGAVTTSSATVAGALQTPANLTGALNTSTATVTGSVQAAANATGAVVTSSATVSGALQTPANLTGALSTSSATVAGSLQTPVSVTGALNTATPTVAGSVELVDSENLTGAVSTSSATVSGALETPVNITGALTTASPTVAGSVQLPAELTGSLTTAQPSVTGSVDTQHSLTGALSTAPAIVAGSVQGVVDLTGALTTASASVAGGLQGNENDLTGAVTTSSASVTGALQTPHPVDGALSLSSPQITGAVTTVHNIAAAVTTSSAAVIGSVVMPVDVTGAVVTSSATVSGDLDATLGVSGALATAQPNVAGSVGTQHNTTGAVTTSSASVAGSVLTELFLSGALFTSAPSISGNVLPVPPAGIPGSASFETKSFTATVVLSTRRATIEVVGPTTSIESKSNGTTET